MRDTYLLAELDAGGRWHVWPAETFYLIDSPELRVRAALQGARTLEHAVHIVLSMLDTAILSSSSWRQDADLWHEIRYSIHSQRATVEEIQNRAEKLIAESEGKDSFEDIFEGNYYAIHAYDDELHFWKMARCRAKLYIADNYGDNEATFVCRLPLHHGGRHGYWFNRGREKNVLTTWEHDEFFDRWLDQVNSDLDRDLEQMSEADPNRVCFMRDDGTVPCCFSEEDALPVTSGQRKTTKDLKETTCYFCRNYG